MRYLLVMLTIAAACLFSIVAFADPSVPVSPPSPAAGIAMLWPMIGTVLAAGWAYLQRKLFSKPGGLWNSDFGHGLITLIGAVLNAVIPIVQQYNGGLHGFPWVALAWAAVGAVTTFLAAANASVPFGEAPPKHPDSQPGAVVKP